MAAGSATQWVPSVAPRSSTTVSIRMMRSWNRCVCTTQPRLTVAPSASVTRSASGSQYVSHHTPRPIVAPRPRNHRFITGVPLAARANHGAATVSTNVSATSWRHTNDDHNGCSMAVIRPTTSHFAITAIAPATAPATSSTTPEASAVHKWPNRITSACSAKSTATPIENDTRTGISRQVSTPARISFSFSGGSNVRSASAAVGLRRNRTGGLPSHDEPALALCGVADSTATSPSSGTLRPGWVIPEFPRNARLPMVAFATWIQPPPSS